MSNTAEVQIVEEDDSLVPTYAQPGDAGADLRSEIDADIPPGVVRMVPAGIRIAIPDGYVGLVCPRSGLAMKHYIGILNAPGVVDAGYRGTVGVLLINHGTSTFHINKGERIAQLLITPVTRAVWKKVDQLEDTDRGESGFGSTGRR